MIAITGNMSKNRGNFSGLAQPDSASTNMCYESHIWNDFVYDFVLCSKFNTTANYTLLLEI